MKNTWLRYSQFLLQLSAFLLIINISVAQECTFPESEIEPFFFDVKADLPADSVIVDTAVDPADAELRIVNVRSNSLPEIDFTDKFDIEQRAKGQFMVLSRDSLRLPQYPSPVNETYLYMTVLCNNHAYPLITIRVKNYNTFEPKFYNEPYEVVLPGQSAANTLINTPLLALDADPEAQYPVTYKIESGQYSDEFALITSRTDYHPLKTLPKQFRTKPHWHPEQLPPIVKLHVQHQPRDHEYRLNISATDSGTPPRKTFATLRVIIGTIKATEYLRFTQKEYFANFSKLLTVDTEISPNTQIVAQVTEQTPKRKRSRVMYELAESDYSDYFLLDHRTALLTIRNKLTTDVPSTFSLTIKAFLEKDTSAEATTTLTLTDISDESLTYFSKCFYEVKIPENSYPDTLVTRLQIHGTPDDVHLLNGTDYFRVDSKGHLLTQKPFDREVTESIVIQAQLVDKDGKDYPHSNLCTTATIQINVDDINDNSPKFEKLSYVFYTDEIPYNNTEIGTVKAFDNDKGNFGKVHYRILTDDPENVPFTLFESNTGATIYYVTRRADEWPDKMYTFTVEAYDSAEEPRVARVAVQVILHEPPEGHDYDVADSRASHVLNQDQSLASLESADVSTQVETQKVIIPPKKQLKKPASSTQTSPRKTQPKTIIRPMSQIKKTSEQFELNEYRFSVYGQIQEGQYVGTIRVANPKDDIIYELEQGIRGFFRVEPQTGHLYVDKRLLEDDYEEVRFSALAKRNGNIIANVLVTVILDDSISIYELTPRFEQSLYRFEIAENEAPQDLGKVQAHHRAVEVDNDRMVYTLHENNDSKAFIVDPLRGTLSSNQEFDREKQHLYTIGITGCLQSNSSSCDDTQAVIVILDVNDNAPVFEEDPYKVTISTDVQSQTELVTIKASDADLGKNGQVRYELLLDGKGNFNIDEFTGELHYIGEVGELKVNRRFQLKVKATDNGIPPLSSETTVTINVGGENTNPNAPEFTNFRYEVTLPANVPADFYILSVEATDADPGPEGDIFYKISDNDVANHARIHQLFTIDPKTGEIKTKHPLNANTDGPVIQFVVEAHDASVDFPRKSETVVMLRFKERNAAKLEFVPLPKTVFISSEKPVGSEIISISAKTIVEDDFHKIRYGISVPDAANYFEVPSNTGSLRVRKPLIEGRFPVTLTAYIPGTRLNATHSMMIVVMTDRDKYPVFEKLGYEMKVPISAAFPVKLEPLNATLSTGHIEYSLYQAERLPKGISVDKVTGQLTIFEEFVSAFDGAGNVFVVIRARNMDWPTFYSDTGVTLILSDTSTTLAFPAKLYRLVIVENKMQGTTLDPPIEVANAEEIGNVEYFVEPVDSLFAINRRGELYLKKTVDLEELPPTSQGIVEITVVARHNGEKAMTKVQIKVEDENEFTPIFLEDQYDFDIREQPADGQAIGVIKAVDEDFTDKGHLKYQIVASSGEASTVVDILQNGTIVKKPGTAFKNGINEMIVEALDYVGHSTEVVVSFYVRIDGNQSTPPPEPQLEPLEVNEKWRIQNSIIGSRFAVFGLPNARWQFSIGEGNEDGIFGLREINDTMAEVEIIAEPNITATNRKLEVEVINVDNPRQTVMTNIEVDLSNAVTSKAPQFIQTSDNGNIKLPSNFNPNAVIITAKATQSDGNNHIRYEIVDDNKNMFEINPTSGEVTFAQNDHPKLPGKYDLTIKATASDTSNGTTYSTEKVYSVEILPLTEDSSLSSTSESFVEPSTESSIATQPIMSSTAAVEISSPVTEIEEPATPSPTTHEQLSTSVVTEQIDTSTTVITTDVTSNVSELPNEPETEAPTNPINTDVLSFDQDVYSFLAENQKRGSKVGEIQLLGAHLGAHLQMQITPPEMAEMFRIDPETSEIFLKKVPESSQESQEYVFNVTVIDIDNPQRRAQTEVAVTMMPFVVSTSGTNTESMFPSSDPQQGTSTSIDAVTTQQSEIPTNEAPSAKPIVITTSSSTSTTETLPDIRFVTTQFTGMLPEGRYGSGGAAITLKPSPINSGMPPGVLYSIDSSSMTNDSFPFSIREDTGGLIVFGEVDRETIDLYEFIVTATYISANQEVSDSAIVQIRILDVNDNAPVFVDAPHVVALTMDTRVGSVIANFKVEDKDEGTHGTVTLDLNGDHKDYFSLDNNGLLTLTKELSKDLGEKTNLAIVASDGGRPALKTEHMLTIELYSQTEQKPVFKESMYSASLAPTASRGQFVTQAVAGIDKMNYSFDNSYSNLFVVNEKGVISLGRNPLQNERNQQYLLNLTATDSSGAASSTVVNVFLEDQLTTQTPMVVSTVPIKGDPTCEFKSKVYNAEIPENTPGRRLLVKVGSDCKFLPSNSEVNYIIHQGSKEFEMNEKTGELFVNAPLDRENRTLHFVVVNLTISFPQEGEVSARKVRNTGPIVEYARSKLTNNQALIVVRVVDENDNLPQFTRTNSKNEYVFPVNWQASSKPIGSVQATDADEKSNITYTFTEPSDYFSIDATTGVVTLTKSLENSDEELYNMEVQAFDGKHVVKTRVKVYPLMPGVNVIVLTVKNPHEEINDLAVSRELTEALEMSTRILFKRVYVNEDNSFNPQKSQLLIYALRKETHEPVPAAELKEHLEKVLPNLASSPHFNIESITLPVVASKIQMTNGEIIALAVAGILFISTCIVLVLCLRACKRRTSLAKSDGDYMVDAESNGPRPYNVELISRRTAQNVLAGRELPNPFEEVKLSSHSRASLLTSSGMIFNDGQLDRSLPSVYSASQHDTVESRSTGPPPLNSVQPPPQSSGPASL